MIVTPVVRARVLGVGGGADVPLQLRGDEGEMVLDSAEWPHVQGDLVVSVPDAGLLDDLDPRDGRRVVLDAYPNSVPVPVYSPWDEQRRNWHPNPVNQDAAANGMPQGATPYRSGGAAGTYSVSAGWQYLHPSSVPLGGRFGVRRYFAASFSAGQQVRILARRRPIALPAGLLSRVYLDFQRVGGGLETFNIPWDSESLDQTFTLANDVAYVTMFFWIEAVGGDWSGSLLDWAFSWMSVEDAATSDGTVLRAGAATDLRREVWAGVPYDSPSVQETRQLLGYEPGPIGTPRRFDLGVREANPDREAGTVLVRVASDEALLQDYRPLTGVDLIGKSHDVALLVEEVIKIATGRVVDVTGPTGSVYPLWEVTNLIETNPDPLSVEPWRVINGGSGLTTVVPPVAGLAGGRAVRITAAAGTVNLEAGAFPAASEKVTPVTPGLLYTASVAILSQVPRSARIIFGFLDENNRPMIPDEIASASVTTSATGWTRLRVTGRTPKLARYGFITVLISGNAAGNLHYLDVPMITAGGFLSEPFKGSSTSPDYVYRWQAQASRPSVVTRIPTRTAPDREALFWRAGLTGMELLAPLLQVLGLRLVCDEQRRWSLRDVTHRDPGGLAFRYGVNIITASEELARDSGEWFDAAIFRYKWVDLDGIPHEQDDTYQLGPVVTQAIFREIDAPWPGAGRAEYAVQRAQGRGRVVTVSRQARWDEHAEQPLTVQLEGTPVQTGISERVVYDLAENTVTVTSRTVDTPDSAWVMLPGGQKWTDSPAGQSWIGEVI